MADTLRLNEQFYIVAEATRTRAQSRVLKQGDSFAVFDEHGDMIPDEASEHGLYRDGTRHLSRLELLLGPRRPLLLSSSISDDNAVFAADLTNPDMLRDGVVVVPRGEIHIFRSRVLWDGSCVERIRVSNHGLRPIELPLALRFDADFADIFEVRGTRRPARGERLPDRCTGECVLSYRGLDGVERRTRISVARPPDLLEPGLATFTLLLDPHATADLDVTVVCEAGAPRVEAGPYAAVLTRARERLSARSARACEVVTSNETFNRWIRRSLADLEMMLTDTPHGLYPYAGIPWFSTPFGRDGIITALELLWVDPEIARGVLGFLADTQATAYADAQDAQPGKILHEMRGGEMAALGEIPFGRYYGSADATPLFVILADRYLERTGDTELIDRIWPNLLAALDWIDGPGDADGDGFVEYARRSATGLSQQGWKDSQDSIFHADGLLAEPPIALCEVQAYAYGAWSGAARLAWMRGDERRAREWRERADRLRARFEDAFWCEELGTYALALDGDKRPCRVRTSNPGHGLFTGIVAPERASRVAAALMSDASFTGWGVRTVAAGEMRYNPMSYHNGSIWPHDNAIVAAGLSRYGLTEAATRVLNAIFDISQFVDLHRLPELICGFHRRGGEAPTLYPVACAPQAWAAGAVYLLLQACLGLHIDAIARRISWSRAALPDTVDWLRLTRLAVGDAEVDLGIERHPHDVGVTVLRRRGEVEIVTVK